MPFLDHRQTSPDEKDTHASPKQSSGLVSQLSPVEQLSFPEDVPSSNTPLPPEYEAPASLVVTRTLENSQSPNTTKMLPANPTTGNLSAPSRPSGLREPVVIRATGKKSRGTLRPPRGRRMVIHVAVTALLAFIVLGTLISVIPVGSGAHGVFQLFSPLNKMFNTKENTIALIAAQAATATAVTQDGYDPAGSYQSVYAGVPTAPADASSGGSNRFYYGQCTWWASYRYHQLTGKWPSWLGNAYEWYYGALNAGWTVSTTPHVPSIMVMMPGVQGASYGYGHVAIVEQMQGGGQVMTSNFNWGFGNWGIRTDQEFHQGPGVWFISFPGL
jgi:surface antigen